MIKSTLCAPAIGPNLQGKAFVAGLLAAKLRGAVRRAQGTARPE